MNFQEFILENHIIELINENSIMASGGFLEKLEAMSKKNKIAKILYDLFDNQQYVSGDLSQNWIDVAGEDTVSFMSDTKANKLNWSEEVPYTAKGRSVIKVGRFVNALLNNSSISSHIHHYVNREFELKSKDVEEFVNLYKATNVDDSKKFKLVKGEDIAKWYDEDKYASERGTLGSSCMKNVNSDYFDIYVKNDKSCRLLIFINGDKKLIGRALVWKIDSSELIPACEAQYFMDRVYAANDSDFIKFKDFAIEQGWLYKNRNSFDPNESLLFRYNETPVFGKIVVKLKDGGCDEYPFVDTMSFLDENYETLSNVGSKNSDILCSTSGDTEKCSNCDGTGEGDCNNCTGGKVTCEECDGNGSYKCDKCEGKGTIGRGKSKETCEVCDGDGYIKCVTCEGEGTTACEECDGGDVCPDCVGLMDATKKMIKGNDSWKEYRSLI